MSAHSSIVALFTKPLEKLTQPCIFVLFVYLDFFDRFSTLQHSFMFSSTWISCYKEIKTILLTNLLVWIFMSCAIFEVYTFKESLWGFMDWQIWYNNCLPIWRFYICIGACRWSGAAKVCKESEPESLYCHCRQRCNKIGIQKTR